MTLAAFGRDTLLDTRWLLVASAKSTSGIWHQILRVTEIKQILFLERLLHLHLIQTKRGGKACAVRLSLSEWNIEVDRTCLCGYILEQMHSTPDLFNRDSIKKVYGGMVDGFLGSTCC